MAETTTLEEQGDLSFWSPWIVFFFGTPFAFLNWSRMNKKGKVVFFLSLNLCVSLLRSWMDFVGGITPTDHSISSKIIFTRFFIALAFTALVSIIVSADIQRFKKEGKASVSVKWPAFFVFWAILVTLDLGTWAILDYGAREVGKCRFPRLQDVIYQREFEQRTALATLVLGRYDFSCDWVWDIEIAKPIQTNEYRLLLTGNLDNNRDAFFEVSESIFQYETITTEDFSAIVQNARQLNYSEYPVNIEDPNARYSNINCARTNEYTFCNLIFGYQNMISVFRLDFSGFSDDQINELIQLVVSTNSQRIQAYERK